MRTVQRPRHYVSSRRLMLVRPFLRYSPSRRAYVLRVVGGRLGPVLRIDRRPAQASPFDGADRRHAGVA
jgi:hypothetical protein